jgi:outer membrane protein assembly factor BamB
MQTERLLTISIGGDRLFAQTSYAMLHTFDVESGRLLWSVQLGEQTGYARGVASNSFGVFVSNADVFYALDKATGRTIWKYALGKIPTCAPACDEDRAMLGLASGKIYAYDLKRKDDKGNVWLLASPVEAWNWATGGPMRTRPLPAENLTAFGSEDGKAYVVMNAERTPLFRISTGGPIGEGLAGFGTRTLLVPSADDNLYAVDLFTADVIWRFPSAAPIQQEPMVADQDIYVINTVGNLSSLDPVADQDIYVINTVGNLSSLDPATGQPRWTTSTHGGRLAAISATKVYLRSADLDLFAVDRKTGRTVAGPAETHQRAGLNLRDYDLNIVNRFNDRLFFATGSGMVICLREAGQVQPRPLKDPKALPLGYVPPEGIKVTPPAPPGEVKIETTLPGREDLGAEKDRDKDKEKEKSKPADEEKDKPDGDKEKEKEKAPGDADKDNQPAADKDGN